jgi:hypothetical protein
LDARIRPFALFWGKKASQNGPEHENSETLKNLEKPWFFNGFSWFFMILKVSFFVLFGTKVFRERFGRDFL